MRNASHDGFVRDVLDRPGTASGDDRPGGSGVGANPVPDAVPGAGFDAGALIDDQLCFALYAANNAMMRAYRPLLAEVGLTYPQYLVLLILWEEGRSTSGRLARRLDLAPNAMTPLLDRLEAKELIRRWRDERDRRRLHVEPTVHGDALRETVAGTRRAIAARTGMDPSAIATLRGELQGLVRRMEDAKPRK